MLKTFTQVIHTCVQTVHKRSKACALRGQCRAQSFALATANNVYTHFLNSWAYVFLNFSMIFSTIKSAGITDINRKLYPLSTYLTIKTISSI